MWEHLNTVHKIYREEAAPKPTKTKQQKLDLFVRKTKMTLVERCVRFLVIDDIPFEKLATSDNFREVLTEIYPNLPKSPTSFRKMLYDFAADKKNFIKLVLKHLLESGVKLCVSFDEWVSMARRR